MKPEIPHRCWIDDTNWIRIDRALCDSCIDPRDYRPKKPLSNPEP
jgi:hypothetical protein